MMRGAIYYGLLVVCVVATTDAFAQKYPERRTARQGTKLYNKGDFAGAEAEYRRALELDPELKEAAFNLGSALWRQAMSQENGQQVAQGAADAWTVIAADSLAPLPMISAASYNLGNVALAGQQIDAAIEAYKGALRLNPDDMDAKYNLAYAQKLKQQQEDQDQNQDQNQDDQGGGGGGQNDDKNEDQDGDGQNNPQNGDGQDDPKDGDGQDDPKDGDGDGDGDPNDSNGNEPPPSGQGGGEPKIDSRAAEQMLDAMQAAEDDTREKVNAKEVQVGAKSGKNW